MNEEAQSPDSDLTQHKQALRERIWQRLRDENQQAFPFKARDFIPNFVGSDAAADRLRATPEWARARTVYANPDYAQRRVRQYALEDGKAVLMAAPRRPETFLRLDPSRLTGREREATTIKGMSRFGQPVSIDDLPAADLVVKGSVAVDDKGGRLGKGHGYGDRELELLDDRGLLGAETTIVTTIHERQWADEVPTAPHDRRVSMVVTPERVIRISPKAE